VAGRLWRGERVLTDFHRQQELFKEYFAGLNIGQSFCLYLRPQL
jgi:hypothetical protein